MKPLLDSVSKAILVGDITRISLQKTPDGTWKLQAYVNGVPVVAYGKKASDAAERLLEGNSVFIEGNIIGGGARTYVLVGQTVYLS